MTRLQPGWTASCVSSPNSGVTDDAKRRLAGPGRAHAVAETAQRQLQALPGVRVTLNNASQAARTRR